MLYLAAILFWIGSDSVDTRYFCYELETNFSDLFLCVVYQFPALVVTKPCNQFKIHSESLKTIFLSETWETINSKIGGFR